MPKERASGVAFDSFLVGVLPLQQNYPSKKLLNFNGQDNIGDTTQQTQPLFFSRYRATTPSWAKAF
eukprot:4389329-Amphidinium_carterae.1